MKRRDLSLSLVFVLFTACSTPATAPDGSTPAVPTSAATTGTLAPPPGLTAAATTSAAAATSATTTAAASAEPAASGSAAATGSAAPSTSAAAEEAPVPKVKVANIGMHIGGGPHDAVTKAPIKTSVEPHFDALKLCWRNVEDPKKGGDFGLDLLIDKAGGKAKISHPRTSLKGAGFKECVVGVFEKIDFKKPRGGTTMVSYSIRFTP